MGEPFSEVFPSPGSNGKENGVHEFLTTALSFPAVVFSAVPGVALLYWLVVIFGALDLDFLDSARQHGLRHRFRAGESV